MQSTKSFFHIVDALQEISCNHASNLTATTVKHKEWLDTSFVTLRKKYKIKTNDSVASNDVTSPAKNDLQSKSKPSGVKTHSPMKRPSNEMGSNSEQPRKKSRGNSLSKDEMNPEALRNELKGCTVVELREKLADRQLKKTGRKAELIDRLVESILATKNEESSDATAASTDKQPNVSMEEEATSMTQEEAISVSKEDKSEFTAQEAEGTTSQEETLAVQIVEQDEEEEIQNDVQMTDNMIDHPITLEKTATNESPVHAPQQKDSNTSEELLEQQVAQEAEQANQDATQKCDEKQNGIEENSPSKENPSISDSTSNKEAGDMPQIESTEMKAQDQQEKESPNNKTDTIQQNSSPMNTPVVNQTSNQSTAHIHSQPHMNTQHETDPQTIKLPPQLAMAAAVQQSTMTQQSSMINIPSQSSSKELQSTPSSTPVCSGVQTLSTSGSANHTEPQVHNDDNYEMSDHEGDSDSSDAEHQPRKPIPDWARGKQLESALHQQYGNGGPDPDRIFDDVNTCDLEAIFPVVKRRFRVRTSSAHWLPDRVTAEEKRRYRTAMGL